MFKAIASFLMQWLFFMHLSGINLFIRQKKSPACFFCFFEQSKSFLHLSNWVFFSVSVANV